MKMKAPQVSRESLVGLKTLINFDFARSVKKVVEEARNPEIHPAETTLKILTLSEAKNDAEQPLAIVMAMIDMTGAANAWLPLNDDRFAMYSRIINLEVTEEDFNALPPEINAKAREIIGAIQGILKKDFEEASMIDPQEMMRGPGAVSMGPKPMGGKPPPPGTLN